MASAKYIAVSAPKRLSTQKWQVKVIYSKDAPIQVKFITGRTLLSVMKKSVEFMERL